MNELRNAFDDVLNVKGICPEDSLYFVSIGTALCANKQLNIIEIINNLEKTDNNSIYTYLEPLFNNEE